MTQKFHRALSALASALVLAVCVATTAAAQSEKFDRFTADLPQLLEADALTVLTLGLTGELSAKVCMRAPQMFSAAVSQETDNWKKRNASFTRGASAAVTEISARIEDAQGADAKQSYLNQVLLTTATKANSAILRKFNGANVDNALAPTAEACFEVAHYLSSGAADFDRTPEYVRELSRFMVRRGIK